MTPFCVIQRLTSMLEKRALMASGVWGSPGKNVSHSKDSAGNTNPQNLKHINFSLQKSQKAVNIAQIPVVVTCGTVW